MFQVPGPTPPHPWSWYPSPPVVWGGLTVSWFSPPPGGVGGWGGGYM